MSTLRTNTLSDVAGTNSPDVTRGEFLRARYSLNGTGVIAARDSFNISSFTDIGTGSYEATFSTAMPNTDYSVAGSAGFSGSSAVFNRTTVAPTVSNCRSICVQPGVGTSDEAWHHFIVFGDKS